MHIRTHRWGRQSSTGGTELWQVLRCVSQQEQGYQLVLWWGFLLVGAVLKCFKSNCVPLPRGKQKGVQVSWRGLLSGWVHAAPATSQRTWAGNLRQNLVAEAPNLLWATPGAADQLWRCLLLPSRLLLAQLHELVWTWHRSPPQVLWPWHLWGICYPTSGTDSPPSQTLLCAGKGTQIGHLNCLLSVELFPPEPCCRCRDGLSLSHSHTSLPPVAACIPCATANWHLSLRPAVLVRHSQAVP